MPYFRNKWSGEVVRTKKDSSRAKDLASDDQWARTPDEDDDKPETSSDLNAAPVATVITPPEDMP